MKQTTWHQSVYYFLHFFQNLFFEIPKLIASNFCKFCKNHWKNALRFQSFPQDWLVKQSCLFAQRLIYLQFFRSPNFLRVSNIKFCDMFRGFLKSAQFYLLGMQTHIFALFLLMYIFWNFFLSFILINYSISIIGFLSGIFLPFSFASCLFFIICLISRDLSIWLGKLAII
jgi:hypothetical protein